MHGAVPRSVDALADRFSVKGGGRAPGIYFRKRALLSSSRSRSVPSWYLRYAAKPHYRGEGVAEDSGSAPRFQRET